jgi:predicted  nucleic acid-binding Zn-ribbon protein
VSTQKEVLELQAAAVTDPAQKDTLTKKIADWDRRIKRWESDPEKREGMKELMAKAQGLEKKRDYQLEQYHNYEIASAALQIAIVLASASIITSMTILAWLSGGVGILGVVFMAFGFWAPDVLMHLFAGGHAAGH